VRFTPWSIVACMQCPGRRTLPAPRRLVPAAADTARIAEDVETRRWWAFTDLCQQPLATAAEGEGWAPAGEVFHLE
jgi:hypothetical protein